MTAWHDEFYFIKHSRKGNKFAFCEFCRTDFSINHGVHSDVTKHVGTAKHKGNAKDVQSSRSLAMFLPGSSQSSTDNITQSVINAETLFQGFIIEHNFPLATECTILRPSENKIIFSWFYHTIFKVLTTQILYPKCNIMHHFASFWTFPPPLPLLVSRGLACMTYIYFQIDIHKDVEDIRVTSDRRKSSDYFLNVSITYECDYWLCHGIFFFWPRIYIVERIRISYFLPCRGFMIQQSKN